MFFEGSVSRTVWSVLGGPRGPGLIGRSGRFEGMSVKTSVGPALVSSRRRSTSRRSSLGLGRSRASGLLGSVLVLRHGLAWLRRPPGRPRLLGEFLVHCLARSVAVLIVGHVRQQAGAHREGALEEQVRTVVLHVVHGLELVVGDACTVVQVSTAGCLVKVALLISMLSRRHGLMHGHGQALVLFRSCLRRSPTPRPGLSVQSAPYGPVRFVFLPVRSSTCTGCLLRRRCPAE